MRIKRFKEVVIGTVRLYQLLIVPMTKVLLGAQAGCRQNPSCSEFFIRVLRKMNFFRAAYFAVWRVIRCQPFRRERRYG